MLDVTQHVRSGVANRLAVRACNPTHQPLDGMTLNQTPRCAKTIPYSAGASYNHGGIVDSVELLAVPQVHLEDLYPSRSRIESTSIRECQASRYDSAASSAIVSR